MNTADLTTEVIAGVHLIDQQQRYSGNYTLENPNLPLNDPAMWEAVFNDSFGTEVGTNVTAQRALMYAPLWHGIALIADDVSRLPLHVFKWRSDISEDAREYDPNHPLNYMLSVAANEETEAVKFWGRFVVHALLWGNAYAWIERDGTGRAVALYNLLPDRTHCERVGGNLIYVTEVTDSERVPRLKVLLPEDVLHVEGLSIANYAGLVMFKMARNSIALGLAQEGFASKFFKNGGRIGGVLELPLGMPKPARDTLEEGFRKAYEGTDNPFKTVILRDNAKFHAGQMSPRDSQMVEASEGQTRMIAHWLKLAPSKLGLSDSVSYNSKAEDNQNYLDTALSIWLVRIAAACNFKLLSQRSSDTHFVEHNVKSLLRMNLLAQAQMHQIQIASRIKNPNECRNDLNLLPYAGGEEYVNPNTMKSGNDTQPAADKTTDTPPPTTDKPPKRDAAYLRVLFGITARARDKAKRPKAFLEWIDGNLQPHRDEWKHLWADAPFPFDGLLQNFREVTETINESQLTARIASVCDAYERLE